MKIESNGILLLCFLQMQKILAARRLQMSTLGKTDIPAPQAPTPHPGYAPHAALHAIKRHAVELMNHKEQVCSFLCSLCDWRRVYFSMMIPRKRKKAQSPKVFA